MDGQPSVMRIDRIADETDQLRLFTLIPEDEWAFIPGQVAVLGLEGVGESYFAIASAPEDKGVLEFLVKDAMTLGDWDKRFASVIDSGLFHIYDGEERQRYVQGLARVTIPGGRLFLFSFADDVSAPGGGVSRQALYDAFADGWDVESLQFAQGELNAAFAAAFPEKFATLKMWFAIIRRKE